MGGAWKRPLAEFLKTVHADELAMIRKEAIDYRNDELKAVCDAEIEFRKQDLEDGR